jgi:hypothetical protein
MIGFSLVIQPGHTITLPETISNAANKIKVSLLGRWAEQVVDELVLGNFPTKI